LTLAGNAVWTRLSAHAAWRLVSAAEAGLQGQCPSRLQALMLAGRDLAGIIRRDGEGGGKWVRHPSSPVVAGGAPGGGECAQRTQGRAARDCGLKGQARMLCTASGRQHRRDLKVQYIRRRAALGRSERGVIVGVDERDCRWAATRRRPTNYQRLLPGTFDRSGRDSFADGQVAHPAR